MTAAARLLALPVLLLPLAAAAAVAVLSLPKEDADSFAQAIVDAKNSVRLCPVCQNLTDQELCGVCAAPEVRDTGTCGLPLRGA